MVETHVDGLTKLNDRVALENDLEEAIRKGHQVAVALLDVDHFMSINSTLGHSKGDEVLQYVVNKLNECEGAQSYRTSGDEFAILFPRFSLEQAFLAAEDLRKSVGGTTEEGKLTDFQIPLTVSVGVAQYPRDAKDAVALLKAADSALWAVKEAGRNRVGLPVPEEMVLKSCQYSSSSLRRLKMLAEKLGQTESSLLREALTNLLQKYDE